jgi:hypothetical protein
MTKDEVERATDELLGQLLDAVTKTRSGGEMAIWLRVAAEKIRKTVQGIAEGDVVEDFIRVFPSLPEVERARIRERLKDGLKAKAS